MPVDARPERAEVFVDGASAGFTPLELELARNRSYRIEVRYAGQVRTFELASDVQGAMIGLDLVPVAVMGGLAVVGAAFAGVMGDSGNATPAVVALVGVSLVPLAVDFGSGAIYRLTPREILAVFD